MSDMLNIKVCDGKYTLIQDSSGKLRALRYDEEWRNCCGDGLLLGMGYQIQSLQQENQRLREALEHIKRHQEMIIGDMSHHSVTYTIAKKILQEAEYNDGKSAPTN